MQGKMLDLFLAYVLLSVFLFIILIPTYILIVFVALDGGTIGSISRIVVALVLGVYLLDELAQRFGVRRL